MNLPSLFEVDEACLNWMIGIRRDLHRHPELSWKEERTSQLIADHLSELGIEAKRVDGSTGIIAEIQGLPGSPLVALRADIDALPIREETGLEFASSSGFMHACGHDGHTAMLLGAARSLSLEHSLPVSVRLIFQPAEELGTGAKALIDRGVLEGVQMIFGGHLDRHYPNGTIVVSDGIVNASTDTFRIAITGQGGHAARPHESIDAVVVGSLLVTALQTIVSREINPAYPSVVTIGRFDAGTACNVIAAQAILEGTIRAQHPSVRQHLKSSLERIASAIGQLHGAGIIVEFFDGTPAVINNLESAKIARQVAIQTFGEDRVLDMKVANMGGEDFSYYLEQVPGCYVRFGAQIEGKEGYPAHSSKFDFDESALAFGASYYHAVAKAAGKLLCGVPAK
ncbi:M20 family metallopeptidase [soil metagenome]